MENNYCDGSGPHTPGEVRVLPTGGDSNAILCRSCYFREMKYRRDRNHPNAKMLGYGPVLDESAKFDLPSWESLKVYA